MSGQLKRLIGECVKKGYLDFLQVTAGRGRRNSCAVLLANWFKGNNVVARGVTTTCVNAKLSDDILKSWTEQVISQTSEKDSLTSDGVKRPPVATFHKSVIDSTVEAEARKGPVKLRRRITDNTWTAVPMDKKIIWVDCEMTGLDPLKDKLIEIGIIITDGELNEIATHDSVVFHCEDSVLDSMHPWCIKHHGASGLTDACRKSTITHQAADEDLLKFLQQHTTPGECPMAGNSIGQDRAFIRFQLPKFYSHFHYRDIDVSTIKELVRRWYPEAYDAAPRKKQSHRVLDDIKESIEELKYYRSTVFTGRRECVEKVRAVSTRNQ